MKELVVPQWVFQALLYEMEAITRRMPTHRCPECGRMEQESRGLERALDVHGEAGVLRIVPGGCLDYREAE